MQSDQGSAEAVPDIALGMKPGSGCAVAYAEMLCDPVLATAVAVQVGDDLLPVDDWR
ncbi:MAG TPA: hypothetical protein VFA99_14490 [Acidobacteriaceae bacterium]|nr:hypothetical protein [Acidobacteriaceae bacterium]